jgi:GR25 family glycosyltransferase involved in LPS biosynthesis
MRVAITAHFQFSAFSGGGASTVLALAETLKLMGHSVSLLNLNGTQEWWDDLLSLKPLYPRINVADVREPFDIVFEVANTLADKETRARCGKQCIWIVRKPILISDIENCIFPVGVSKRNLEGLTAVWCLDAECTDDEIQYLETLARVPVRKVPYIWTPSMVEIHRKEIGLPTWLQVAVSITQQEKKQIPWSVHICETNNSAMSSCTIPLVTLREAKRQGKFYFSKYKVHNAQPVEKSEFFKQNVLKHCEYPDLSGEFLGRQRVVDWLADPMSCVLGHLRFRQIRPYLLDTLWCGIPLVHNSPILKSFGCGFESYFYEDNSITGAANALLQLQNDIQTGKGMFHQESAQKLQQTILERVSPISTHVQTEWKKAIEALPTPRLTAPVARTQAPVATPVSKQLSVLFTDMWDGFNPEYNVFLLMLQEATKNQTPRPHIQGYSIQTLTTGTKPDLLFFGPFGDTWKQQAWAGIPKAHFTGENTAPVQHPDVFLNMGYPHMDFMDERYIRVPLWMLEIDWFGANPDLIQNPKPVPLDRCVNVYPEEIGQKTKFCAFVVTNPCNPVRNDAFHWLSQYKKVDSAGRLFNNIGDEIFAGLGGGGGELKKHEFLKQYKFCLAYENSSSQGYTTEKLLHAKAAGCIPIYWGDPKVDRDFDIRGFLDARSCTSPQDLIELVRKVDQNPSLYLQMVSVPALDEFRRDMVRRIFSQIATTCLKAAKLPYDTVPRFLGATTSAEAAQLAADRSKTVPSVAKALGTSIQHIRVMSEPKNANLELPKNPMILTMASERFLPSLAQMLQGLQAQQKSVPGLEVRVFTAKDVKPTAIQTMKESFSFVSFHSLPEETTPEGFPEYWNPQHFAWKLWIYNTAVHDPSLNGRLVWYMDAGIFMCRWPRQWLQLVMENGICALHDSRETNDRWCHETFCKALEVSTHEKVSNQIIAGCLAFLGGNAKAKAVFSEAYEWSKKREVITGEKWQGVRDGKPFGHRHDQSILSILTQRHDVVRYPLDEVYCDHSLRKTFLTGKSLYVHRGAFTVHKPFSKWIDDAYVINLDRRDDRMEKLFTHNPELKDRVERLSAVEGKTLQLTPTLARLFKPHDFFWKKAIMGCALSHLTLWWQLVHEKPEISTYLIMEDDVKLQQGWEEKWREAAGHVPDDADVVYLGGILPPNRQGFQSVKEKVNAYFSRVGPNQMFGQKQPNRYFHWCNYAYILTRKGAEKILTILMENDGYWTSADHMVCNRVDRLNHYFLDPLVAGCYQDDDPKYQTSAFNDFSRIDGFDSDLWNNDQRFSTQEVEENLRLSAAQPINIAKAIEEAHSIVKPQPKPKSEAIPEIQIGAEAAQAKQVLSHQLLSTPPTPAKRIFMTLEEHSFREQFAYEREWIQELIGKSNAFTVKTIRITDPAPTVLSAAPIVIVQRPHFDAYRALFAKWNTENVPFYILHLSDEYCKDPIDFYSFPMCRGVVRIYNHPSLPSDVASKVCTIPLGYHWTLANGSDDPTTKTPRLPFRNTVWSFYGTGWYERKQQLAPLTAIEPHSLLLVDSWESNDKLSRNQYISRLLDTIFVPCPGGNNIETFRLYEALECGCIPLYVKTPGDDAYVKVLQDELGLLPVSSWSEAKVLVEHFMREKELMENYRTSLLLRWAQWKQKLGTNVRRLWGF